jgi:hypothetical protein
LIHYALDGGILRVSSYRISTPLLLIECSAIADLGVPPYTRQPQYTAEPQEAGSLSDIRPERPAWQELEIPVDGIPRTFKFLEKGSIWSAFAQVEGVYIKIFASAFRPSNVSLVRIIDPAVYLR